MRFPEATYAWRRLKLLIAECIILSLAKGDHSLNYTAGVLETSEAIKEFRELYYPHPRAAP